MKRITLTGDVMIGRSFNKQMKEKPKFHIWGDTRTHLASADFLGINLETTITHSTTPWKNKVFNYKLNPNYMYILDQIGPDYVSLANNHILDYNLRGLKDTISNLDKLNIHHGGADINKHKAQEAVTFNHIPLTVLSSADHYHYWEAGKTINYMGNRKGKYGINWVDIEHGQWQEQLELVRKNKTHDKLLIYSIHWGPNYANQVSQKIKDFAHNLLDTGVDIIHGHSAHHVQPLESWRDSKLIFYSMGDFIDDYVVDPYYRNDLSFIADIYIKGIDIKKVEILPTKIKNMQVNFVTDETERKKITDFLEL